MYEQRKCNFCSMDPEKERVIFRRGGITVFYNRFPTKNTADAGGEHLLLIPDRHLLRLEELNNAERIAFFDAIGEVSRELDIPGGGLLARFGDPLYHTGTIEHLHANLFEPALTGKVRPPLAKEPEEVLADETRARRFARVYLRMQRAGQLEAFLAGKYEPPEGANWDGKAPFRIAA